MKTQKILKTLSNDKFETFIDTIEAECRCCALVGKENGWEHHGKGDYYVKTVPCRNGTVTLTFKPAENQKGLNPKEGNIKVRFSPSKVYYGDNVTGVLYKHSFTICRIIDNLLEDEKIFTTGVGKEISFVDFAVTRIDRSICFDTSSPERLKEMLRLFKMMYFPYHKPGKRCSKDYDYKTSYCHTSNSEDIIGYDKSAEFKASYERKKLMPPPIKDNIFRIEICSKKPLGIYKDFGTVNDVLKNGNKTFAKLLEARNLYLDFAPEDEYWALVTAHLEKQKEIYLSDNDRASKKYPGYITRKTYNVVAFLRYINENGAAVAHRKNREFYKDCVELTSELGISVLYTAFKERINFF